MQTTSRRNMPAQSSFVPGQTLTAAELNNFETQSIVVGNPTSGGAIAGAVNAQNGIYVNGVAVGGASGTPGGAAGNVQYNSAGTSFGGSTGLMLNPTSVTGMTMNLTNDAPGDLYFRNAAGAMARLGIGTAGQILEVSGGLPSWQPVATGGGTVSGGGAAPQIAQYTAANVVSPATLSGDATIAAGGALTIQPAAVSYAKMQAASVAQRLIGSAVGATVLGEITLGTNLSMTGSTLNAAGGAAADTVTRGIVSGGTGGTGTTQATATQLASVINEVTTVAAGTGCALPAATVGEHCYVRNSGANALTLYPRSGDSAIINAQTADAPVVVPTNTTALLVAVAATQWYTVP